MKSSHEANKTQTARSLVRTVVARDYQLLILCLPAIIYMILFDYSPIWGLQIAFKDFSLGQSIRQAKWTGFENLIRFIQYPYFFRLLRNTITIAILHLVIPFPVSIIFALIINTAESRTLKKVYQTIVYAPHFISVVVLVGMIYIFGSPRGGIVNILLGRIGIEPIFFLGTPSWIVPILVSTEMWQHTGFGSIIYLAALGSVPAQLHESAMIDGASRWKRIIYIDIPSIVPTIVILLILRIGQLLVLNWQKILLLQNTMNIRVTEVIQTYVYKTGILQGDYSYATAAGLFIAVINLILILLANGVAKTVRQEGLW
jgi:putative aldouronate transport system permease protein